MFKWSFLPPPTPPPPPLYRNLASQLTLLIDITVFFSKHFNSKGQSGYLLERFRVHNEGKLDSKVIELRNFVRSYSFQQILLTCQHTRTADRLLPHCSDKGPMSQIPGVDLLKVGEGDAQSTSLSDIFREGPMLFSVASPPHPPY